MKKRVFFIAVAIIFLATGCKSKITSGEVTDKKFSPAHMVVQIVPVVHSNGETIYTTMVPYYYYYPDTWHITISAVGKDGAERTAIYRVTKEVYEATPLGAEFIYNKTMEPQEPEYTRERKDE